ncbi:1-hydroxy-2-methyl-2-(E)-butenyl4-diphosphate synthase [Bordetella pertussis]|nr:1-hydroxy-2-methyl-2-(E)-butenyl4-diphosphate synthase [Bordetella pertussis]
MGGNASVVVQSMTNTDTADAVATAIQVTNSSIAWASRCRWWAISTTTATSC